ncbi:MAG: class I SAM-dependent methyltransferase, partial [Bacilli bacterium]|nr:class I SAM-dependent methyltransferase [Bacilli bacterium]
MGYYENHVEDYIAFSAENPIRPEHAEFLKRLKPDSLILDVGFGAANDMRHFQKEGMRVCGIDLCEPFVERAKNFGLDVRALSILDL